MHETGAMLNPFSRARLAFLWGSYIKILTLAGPPTLVYHPLLDPCTAQFTYPSKNPLNKALYLSTSKLNLKVQNMSNKQLLKP
jgi:hypothetical protein